MRAVMRRVMSRLVAPAVLLLSLQPAHANDEASGKDGGGEKPVVLLNATAKLGDLGPVDKIRRVLDTRGLLYEVPEGLAAALDGRNLQITDADAIRDAYKSAKFEEALRLVEDNEARILQQAAGDPLPALAELSQWRGLIAVGRDDKDEAVAWFRAALRFNPAWTLDTALAGPKVARLIQKARKEASETGKLRVTAEPAAATVAIDGGKPQPADDKLTLPAGHHLVTITAEGRTSYSELVEVVPGKTVKVAIALDRETKSDKAARLVDATVAAPPGQARLQKVRGVSRFVGATRFLVIEDTSPERTVVRVYDVDMKKVSRQIDVEGTASSAAIARKVLAALAPENMVDAGTVVVVRDGGARPRRWYERWYVWAGVAAVAGGGAFGAYYMTREPSTIRGF
jgi:hypothetical protein